MFLSGPSSGLCLRISELITYFILVQLLLILGRRALISLSEVPDSLGNGFVLKTPAFVEYGLVRRLDLHDQLPLLDWVAYVRQVSQLLLRMSGSIVIKLDGSIDRHHISR